MRNVLIICMLLLAACESPEKKTNNSIAIPKVNYYKTDKDTLRDVVFKFDKKEYAWLFKGRVKAETLSNEEIVTIKKMIDVRVNLYNKDHSRDIIEPQKYYKQYIAVTSDKGEKEVWVNCLCQIDENWKKQYEIVSDGGNCYFQIKINLSRKAVLLFKTNGLA